MIFWKAPKSMGWGNILLSISGLISYHQEIQVHSSLLDVVRGVEFAPCIHFVDEESKQNAETKIIINSEWRKCIHQNIAGFIRPSAKVQERIDSFAPVLTDVTCGIHIRRGAYSTDSANGTDSDGPAYFASDAALDKFKEIITHAPGKVFLASDSKDLKQQFKELFGDKIVTYACDVLKNYDTCDDDRLDCYVEWFLLSMCPKICVTGGDSTTKGISTYGYTAGCYGDKEIGFVFNEWNDQRVASYTSETSATAG